MTLRSLIPAPPDDVLAYVADTRNDPEWCPNVETAELVSGDGTSEGSVFRYRQYLDTPGSKRLTFEGETTITSRTNDSITWSVTDRFQRREISLTVEPHSAGTRITQVTRAAFHRPPGLARWVYPVMAKRILRRQFAGLARRFT